MSKPAATVTPASVKTAAKATEPNMANYNKAVRSAKAASAKAGTAAWIIGDAAMTVATEYGKSKLEQFSDDIGVEVTTVRNFRTMAAAYPTDKIARDLQTASVYGIFASQDDRFALVTDGSDGAPWKSSEAKALVKSRKTSDDGPAGDGDGDESGSDESGAPEVTRDKLVANIARLQAALLDAELALAEYDAANLPESAPATVHSVKGIPSHDASDHQANCPMCLLAATPAA